MNLSEKKSEKLRTWVAKSNLAHKAIIRIHINQENTKMSFIKKLFIEEDGQDMVEYGLVLALAVLAAGAVMTTFKGTISTAFTNLGTDVTTNIK